MALMVRLSKLLLLLVLSGAVVAQPSGALSATDSERLRACLKRYLDESYEDGHQETRFIAKYAHLKLAGAPQIVVYFTDPKSCGSGGCTTLVLTPEGSSYRVVSSMTIVWPPIRVLNSQSHGWRDLAVRVRGGGIIPGYEAVLPFDGSTYPTNPSVPPSRRLRRAASGSVLIRALEQGIGLYEK